MLSAEVTPSMEASYSVIDTDMHIRESFEAVAKYFEEPWRSRVLEGGNAGKEYFWPTGSSGDRFGWGRLDREGISHPHGPMDPDEVYTMMEYIEADKAIVLSHMMLRYGDIKSEDDRVIAFAKGCTEYMLDQVTNADDGIYTALPIPYHDPEVAAELIAEYKDEDDIVAGCLVTAGPEPPLGNRKYDPIYEALEDAGLPAIFHTGGSGIDSYHVKGFEKFIETHTLGFLENNMAQLTSIVIQGVPEKFPDLQIAFQESGIYWVPMMMHRLDEEYLKRPNEAPLLERKPSEYMKEFFYGTQPMEVSGDQEFLEQTIKMMGGPERLLYASDYPHWDFDRITTITERMFLSNEEKQRILASNAEEVFGI